MNYLNQSESAMRRAQRDRELMELYCETYDQLRERRVKNLRKTALSIALACGTPRYHVGFDRAYIVVPQMLRGDSKLTFKNPVNKLMWQEITLKVKRFVDEGKMSIAQSITIVLEMCRASHFFLTPDHAWRIIKKELSKTNCRRPYGRA